MNKKMNTWMAVAIGLLITVSLYTQDQQDGQNQTETQKAQELEAFEKNLDEKIAELNSRLANYSILSDQEITHTPVQTTFTKGDGYIQLESYDFIPESYGSAVIVGGKRKTVQLYFSGSSLTKIVSIIVDENFATRETITSTVTDPSPSSVENNDIEIKNIQKDGKTYISTLGDVQNTISNPDRIKFKKEFYIKHLEYFDRSFEYTKKYLSLYGTNTDKKTSETLKNSLKY